MATTTNNISVEQYIHTKPFKIENLIKKINSDGKEIASDNFNKYIDSIITKRYDTMNQANIVKLLDFCIESENLSYLNVVINCVKKTFKDKKNSKEDQKKIIKDVLSNQTSVSSTKENGIKQNLLQKLNYRISVYKDQADSDTYIFAKKCFAKLVSTANLDFGIDKNILSKYSKCINTENTNNINFISDKTMTEMVDLAVNNEHTKRSIFSDFGINISDTKGPTFKDLINFTNNKSITPEKLEQYMKFITNHKYDELTGGKISDLLKVCINKENKELIETTFKYINDRYERQINNYKGNKEKIKEIRNVYAKLMKDMLMYGRNDEKTVLQFVNNKMETYSENAVISESTVFALDVYDLITNQCKKFNISDNEILQSFSKNQTLNIQQSTTKVVDRQLKKINTLNVVNNKKREESLTPIASSEYNSELNQSQQKTDTIDEDLLSFMSSFCKENNKHIYNKFNMTKGLIEKINKKNDQNDDFQATRDTIRQIAENMFIDNGEATLKTLNSLLDYVSNVNFFNVNSMSKDTFNKVLENEDTLKSKMDDLCNILNSLSCLDSRDINKILDGDLKEKINNFQTKIIDKTENFEKKLQETKDIQTQSIVPTQLNSKINVVNKQVVKS